MLNLTKNLPTILSRRKALQGLAALPMISVWSALAQTKPARPAPTPSPAAPGSPKVALVLGSGSARGFAHIGVIKALEAARIKPDMIVGTSAGALVGAFYAAGYTGEQMEDLAIKVKDIEIVDMQSGSKRGMISGETLQYFVNRAAQNRMIEQLPTPFIAVATQLHSGEVAPLRRGDLGLAVRASCSVPGVFIPPKINEREYVDGGLVSPVPVRVAREAGADIVIALDVTHSTVNVSPVGIFEQLMHSFDIMGRSLAKIETEQADLVIRPEVGRIASTDFNSRAAFIQLGEQAGKRFAPVVQEKIASWKTRKRA